MRITTGRVVHGKIEIPGESFSEGSTVTVLAAEDGETFTLSPEEELELRTAMAEADRGEVVPAEDLLPGLRREV